MPSIRLTALLASALLGLVIAPAGAAAAEYWVSPSGSDAAAGTEAAPFQTVGRALSISGGGQTINLAPGAYPSFTDQRARSAMVTVRPAPGSAARPELTGGILAGGTHLRFQGLLITGRLTVRDHAKLGPQYASHTIELTGNRFTNAVWGGPCLVIRSGAHHVDVRGNELDRCAWGITGPGDSITDPADRVNSHHIAIEGNHIHHSIDGMQFAHWDDVRIAGNLMHDFGDPDGVVHSDGIQVTGNSHRVVIERNTIHTGGQLVFLQDAVVGPNSDVEIVNNLIHSSSNYAAKLGGTDRLRIVNNTIWGTRYGGLLMQARSSRATIANNVLDYISAPDGVVAYRDHNLATRSMDPPKPHELIGVDPELADAAGGNYRPLGTSPALLAGTPDHAPVDDLLGASRAPVPTLGAYQQAYDPDAAPGPADEPGIDGGQPPDASQAAPPPPAPAPSPPLAAVTTPPPPADEAPPATAPAPPPAAAVAAPAAPPALRRRCRRASRRVAARPPASRTRRNPASRPAPRTRRGRASRPRVRPHRRAGRRSAPVARCRGHRARRSARQPRDTSAPRPTRRRRAAGRPKSRLIVAPWPTTLSWMRPPG